MLMFIGFDLVLEWIWEVRRKLTTIEYLILLSTFATICFTSLDIGVAVGLGLSVAAFVLSFASEVREGFTICSIQPTTLLLLLTIILPTIFSTVDIDASHCRQCT